MGVLVSFDFLVLVFIGFVFLKGILSGNTSHPYSYRSHSYYSDHYYSSRGMKRRVPKTRLEKREWKIFFIFVNSFFIFTWLSYYLQQYMENNPANSTAFIVTILNLIDNSIVVLFFKKRMAFIALLNKKIVKINDPTISYDRDINARKILSFFREKIRYPNRDELIWDLKVPYSEIIRVEDHLKQEFKKISLKELPETILKKIFKYINGKKESIVNLHDIICDLNLPIPVAKKFFILLNTDFTRYLENLTKKEIEKLDTIIFHFGKYRKNAYSIDFVGFYLNEKYSYEEVVLAFTRVKRNLPGLKFLEKEIKTIEIFDLQDLFVLKGFTATSDHFILNLRLENISEDNISDITIELEYDVDILKVSKIEPEIQNKTAEKSFKIEQIGGLNFKTYKIHFVPLSCQKTQIIYKITYRINNKLKEVPQETFTLYTCSFIRQYKLREEEINSLLNSLEAEKKEINFFGSLGDLKEMLERDAGGYPIIRENEGKLFFTGRSLRKDNVLIEISDLKKPNGFQIKVFTEGAPHMKVGIMADIIRSFQEKNGKVESKNLVKYLKRTIKHIFLEKEKTDNFIKKMRPNHEKSINLIYNLFSKLNSNLRFKDLWIVHGVDERKGSDILLKHENSEIGIQIKGAQEKLDYRMLRYQISEVIEHKLDGYIVFFLCPYKKASNIISKLDDFMNKLNKDKSCYFELIDPYQTLKILAAYKLLDIEQPK
ncbi:MAG: hypothetical protein ACTSRS_20135 [Candidatus Helarchaeota archaeon]